MLLRGEGNLADDVIHFAGLVDNRVEALRDLVADLGARAAFHDRFLDDFGGFLGGVGAAAGEIANLVGDHGKTKACLSGSGGFDGGVQGEDVCLEGDLVNRPDDFGNLVSGFMNLGHGPDHVLHVGQAGFGGRPGLMGNFFRLVGVLGIALGEGGDLLEGGTGFLERGGLFARAFGKTLARGGHLCGGRGELLGTVFQAVGRPHEVFVDSHDDAYRKKKNAQGRRNAPTDRCEHSLANGIVQLADRNSQDVGTASIAWLPVFHLKTEHILAIPGDTVGGVAVAGHAALAHDDWTGIGDQASFVIRHENLVFAFILNLLKEFPVKIGVGEVVFIAGFITHDVKLDRGSLNRLRNRIPCGHNRDGFVKSCVLVVFLALGPQLLGEFIVVERSRLGHFADRVRGGFSLHKNRAHLQFQRVADRILGALVNHIKTSGQREKNSERHGQEDSTTNGIEELF